MVETKNGKGSYAGVLGYIIVRNDIVLRYVFYNMLRKMALHFHFSGEESVDVSEL